LLTTTLYTLQILATWCRTDKIYIRKVTWEHLRVSTGQLSFDLHFTLFTFLYKIL